MRIAIVGAGVSGLVAAYKLHRDHDITVFEANDHAGGHVNTVDVDDAGHTLAIDTGFIVYNDWTYPNFIALLDEFHVETQPTEMSFSVRDDRANLEYNGHSLWTLFAQRRNLLRPRFYRLLADILRFQRDAEAVVAQSPETITVGEFLDQQRYSSMFADHYLLPMGAAIWSCPTGVFAEFPLRFIIEFYRNHGLLSIRQRPTWRVVRGGSREYVRKMTASFSDRIRLRTPVARIRRHGGNVELQDKRGSIDIFDHIVFACHSDQALRLLDNDATATERELLGAFPYSRNVAVLHTDASVLPTRQRAWASWNVRVTGDASAPAAVTYNMNILQGLSSRQVYCVTLNDEAMIDPRRVLARFEYHHPIFTSQRAAAQQRHAEVVTANRTSFCGAYWRNGFHEDGVVSALAVVAAIQERERTQRPAEVVG